MFNRKRILWSVLGFVLTFATAVPAVAALRTATAAREVPVTTADLVGPVWEWTGLVQTLPAARLVVPSPDSYTLQFAGNGDLTILADCNQVQGTYILRGDLLLIEPGSSTMAFCGEESLDQQYLNLLARGRKRHAGR